MTLSSSIYEIARDVSDDLNYQLISSIFTGVQGTDDERKMRRAVKKTARFLYRYWDWPALERALTFTSTANGVQTGAVPADFGRLRKLPFHNATKDEFFYPQSELSEYDNHERNNCYGLFISGSTLRYSSHHAPGDTITGYYITSHYVTAQDGTTKTEVSKDTDRLPWPDEVLHLGLVWALLQRDGDQTSDDYSALVAALNEHITELSPSATLDMESVSDSLDHYGWPREGWGQE